MKGGLGVSHGSQEWEGAGKGLGKLKMKHEKGIGCFSWFPRVGWEPSEASKSGSWFPRVGWERSGKVKNKA